uniref:Anti-proliferative protein domain-containing protein n=1 Tax=Anser cygnoides TaxID=8845 RepID=A0A8B9IIZ4_ANSCY
RTSGCGPRALPQVCAAAAFVTRLLQAAGGIGEERLRRFQECLQEALRERYKHHWFPLTPSRGSGYRCIRINHTMDPLIGEAAGMIGLSHERLLQLLPSDLTIWVDPFEVSYRIGENGFICVLYKMGPAIRSSRSIPSKNYNMMTFCG